jgi:hypothetical protein
MPRQPKPDKTAADILSDVGRALSDDTEDWQARLAHALNVGRSAIQQWRNGRLPFDANHGALDDLLALVTRREAELRAAKRELGTWLKRNRTPGTSA